MTKKTHKNPSSYHVILMGDDRTPTDFIAEILITLFRKPEKEVLRIIEDAYSKGEAICGTYSLEIAETKSAEAVEWARRQEFPLQCRMEKA
jgi:ATP-dependent Clp protease adaptor protein ClpS